MTATGRDDDLGEPTGGTSPGLPDTELGLVVRTDFSDDEMWAAVARDVLSGDSLFPAPIERTQVAVAGGPDTDRLNVLQHEEDPSLLVIDDPRFDGIPPEQLRPVAESIFVADAVTMTHPEHVLLALQPRSADPEDFRLTPGSVDGVSTMLQVGGLLWEELLDQRDDDGVVRRE